MRAFGTSGVAVVEVRRGDSLKTIAQQAYNSVDKWWVVAQANNAMSDYELSLRNSITIPDIRQTSTNFNAVQIDDNGAALLYVNRITGEQWVEYYSQAVSQLEPIVFEDNPNWLRGLAFVEGNFKYNRPGAQYSRRQPFLLMPAEYWYSIKDTGASVDNINTLPASDWNAIAQLPTFSPGYSGNEPILPTIRNTPGGDPIVAANSLKNLPPQVIDTLRMSQVTIVAVRDSMVEYHTNYKDQVVPNSGGRTYNDVAGAYDRFTNTVTFATGKVQHGSASLFEHELGHAYDKNMGDLSSSPMFEEAFHSDFSALIAADSLSEYYTKPDAESSPDTPPIPAHKVRLFRKVLQITTLEKPFGFQISRHFSNISRACLAL
jgi:phage tail protein X